MHAPVDHRRPRPPISDDDGDHQNASRPSPVTPDEMVAGLVGGDGDSDRSSDLKGGSNAGAAQLQPQTNTQKTKKKKRPSHIAKREERRSLVDAVDRLSARLAVLRARAGLPSAEDEAALERARAQQRRLRHALFAHQCHASSAQGLVSQHVNALSPLHPLRSFLHLPWDPRARRARLLALRPEKLARARDFIDARTRFHDPLAPYWVQERFVAADGTAHSVNVEIRQFRGGASVRACLVDYLRTIATLEMAVSDDLGELTIREDGEDDGGSGDGSTDTDTGEDTTLHECFHHRYATQPPIAGAPLQELHLVGWIDYTDTADGIAGRERAIIAGDAVDVDDRAPYQPATRVRRDVSVALVLDAGRDPTTGASIVVLRRCTLVSMPPPAMALPAKVRDGLWASLGSWSRVISRSVAAAAAAQGVTDVRCERRRG